MARVSGSSVSLNAMWVACVLFLRAMVKAGSGRERVRKRKLRLSECILSAMVLLNLLDLASTIELKWREDGRSSTGVFSPISGR